jgi:REP element-mobilizing transposase RayT
MGGILTNRRSRLIAIGGIGDHVHLEVSLPSNLTVADALNALKANSSRWVHENVPALEHFAWQEGYAAFTVSKSADPGLLEYIGNQEEHHLQRDFRSELVGLLQKHGIEYNEKYLWN